MNALTEDIRQRLAKMVRRVCPRWMSDDWEDLAQMAAMRLMRMENLPDLTNAYLNRVAYSTVVDEIRRKKRRNEVGVTPSLFERVDGEELDPERLTNSSQLAEQMLEAIQRLNPDRRRAVTLYLQGHTIKEVGSLLEWPTKKSSNAVYRGLEQLRQDLRARGIAP